MARRAVAVVLTLLGMAVVLSAIGFALIYVLLGREPAVAAESILVLRVGGALSEVPPSDVFGYLRSARTTPLGQILDTLRKAKVDPRIRAVLLEPTGFETPYWGKVQEIRDALLDLRASGKRVVAYLEYGGEREYYLATAADEVYLMPAASLDVTGVATHEVFLRGTLDLLGLYPDLHGVGVYKTAPNALTEKGYTPAHKEMDEALTRSLYEQLVRGIAEGRKKSEADVRQLIDGGPFLTEQALRAGLVDGIAYEDQVRERMRAGGSTVRSIDGDDYARVSVAAAAPQGPRIGVIYAVGTIVSGRSGWDPGSGAVLGSETLIDAIRDARHDSSLRALVVRIDSPGGSGTASEAIWRELTIARTEREDRPLVASMSDLAASGGYYIAMPAHAIVAQASTLTGSIGVFGGKVVTGGLFEKLGARIETTSEGRHADMNSPVRPYNEEELQKVNEQLRAFYDQFVGKVANARHATDAAIDAVAQGRVWTGEQAKARGLLDRLGGLDVAIALAKERAKIDASSPVQLVVYPKPRTFYEMIAEEIGGSESRAVSAWVAEHFTGAELQALRVARGPLALFRSGEPLALMPFTYLR